MQTNRFLIADLQIQWLKQAHKTLMQKNKFLFLMLAGSCEFVLLIFVFLLAQILAGHYSPLKSHALLAIIGLFNIAVVQLTMHFLNSEFDQLWLRLPNQTRWINAARTSFFTLLPMLVFILPSGIFVFMANDFDEQRLLTIFKWFSIVAACFGLHFFSIYQQKLRIAYAGISMMIILSALNPLWWAAVLLVIIFSLMSPKVIFKPFSFIRHSWWLSYTANQHRQMLLHIAFVLLAAALPMLNDDLNLILSIISAPLIFWLSHNNYQRFVDYLMLYPLSYLPNSSARIQTLKRQYTCYLSLLVVLILGIYFFYDMNGVFMVLSIPIILGTLLLRVKFFPSWFATGVVYVSALTFGLLL